MGKRHLVIEDVTIQNKGVGKVGPILPSFQHAPCDPIALMETTKDCKVTADWPGQTDPGLVVQVSTDHMTYTSSNTSRTNKYYNTFVALRDKNTGKTRLIQANETVLSPKIIYPSTKNPLLLQEKVEAKTFAEKMEASKHLIKSFGQAKGQRFYDQQDRMRVDTSQVEEKVMKAAGAVSEDRLTAVPEAESVQIVPKRNDGAGRKEQVYLLEDMLTKVELKHLVEAGDNVLQDFKNLAELKEAQKNRNLSALGVELLNKCINMEGEVGNLAAITLYLEGIVKFSRLRQGEMRKGEKSLQQFLPLNIKKKVFSYFSINNGTSNRIVTPELTDRAICHVIVLALLANNFKLDTSLLTESIRVRPDHLKKLVAMVGAHLSNDSVNQSQFIVLKLPLANFNVNYVGKKKNRKN
eukprot:TRINITY_DN54235_c0_g1_i1.p1 TRINITY_DN54235_c0_g1~~TRINITY_DN54235_c0_g1_i1.p1  ORF type:complete len:409 (-),score=140.97 TRINITY_DN54235_c0_g1_i1:50-1276(-)